jgi:hypothetical protein
VQAAATSKPAATRDLYFQFYRNPAEIIADADNQVRLQAAVQKELILQVLSHTLVLPVAAGAALVLPVAAGAVTLSSSPNDSALHLHSATAGCRFLLQLSMLVACC